MTMQTPDWIILDDRRERLRGSGPWPFPPGFRLNKGWNFHSTSTANQRGYTATWWILADSLFLKNAAGTVAASPHYEPENVSMRDMLGTDKPIFARWFTGEFYIAVREPHHDTSDEEWNFYDEYREIEVVAGRVVAENLVSYEEKRERRQRQWRQNAQVGVAQTAA